MTHPGIAICKAAIASSLCLILGVFMRLSCISFLKEEKSRFFKQFTFCIVMFSSIIWDPRILWLARCFFFTSPLFLSNRKAQFEIKHFVLYNTLFSAEWTNHIDLYLSFILTSSHSVELYLILQHSFPYPSSLEILSQEEVCLCLLCTCSHSC